MGTLPLNPSSSRPGGHYVSTQVPYVAVKGPWDAIAQGAMAARPPSGGQGIWDRIREGVSKGSRTSSPPAKGGGRTPEAPLGPAGGGGYGAALDPGNSIFSGIYDYRGVFGGGGSYQPGGGFGGGGFGGGLGSGPGGNTISPNAVPATLIKEDRNRGRIAPERPGPTQSLSGSAAERYFEEMRRREAERQRLAAMPPPNAPPPLDPNAPWMGTPR